MKTISDFKLTGLSRSREGIDGMAATCEPLDKEEIFWTGIKMSDVQKESLWDFCKTDWANKKIAVIEHEGLHESGLPINPVLITIRYA